MEVALLRDGVPSFDEYPYSLPVVRHLENLKFHPAVTFIVGENATGKSTLLEAIAVALRINPEGGSRNFNFSTQATHSSLHEHLRVSRSERKIRDAFFLRAESFYNVASNLDSIGGLENYGGKSLHEQSHGESFLALFNNRLGPNGLYILDEPEAALSPLRQMSLLVIMKRLVDQGAQFIVATHSPIILAYPDCLMYGLDEEGLCKTTHKQTDHRILKARAAATGVSFSEYLRAELERIARRPSVDAFRRQYLRGVLASSEAEGALDMFGKLAISIFPAIPLRLRCWRLKGRLTAADALFLALAETLGEPLATKDRGLGRAAADMGVPVVKLGWE